MTEQTITALLPCRRGWGDLLDQVADDILTPVDAHQAGCVHCQAALVELKGLWQPLRDLADIPVEIPEGLADRVMARVRDAARDSWNAILHSDRGTTRIAARVIAVIARTAAARVPGIDIAFGRTIGPADPAAGGGTLGGRVAPAVASAGPAPSPADGAKGGADGARGGADRSRAAAADVGRVGVAGQSAVIDLAVTARYGTDLPAAAAEVRRVVVHDVTALTSIPRVRVNIVIDDLDL